MNYIALHVEVTAAEHSLHVRNFLKYRYPNKELLEKIPKEAHVVNNVNFPLSSGMPSWIYTYYILSD